MTAQQPSPELVEAIARAIHERYRKNQADRKPPDDPAMAAWEALPDHLRESNRKQAAHIFEKLRAIGCEAREVGDGDASVFEFSAAEIERMAEMEHDRWTAERLADGWTPGERDVHAKTSPHLVGWEQLPDDVREWDREAVRPIPELLAAAGLEIRRRE